MNPHRPPSEQSTPISTIWCLCFVYAASVASAIQFFILPYLFPQWHAGNGLLQGGDWLTFHHLAVDLAQKIAAEGWSAWTLRPEEQAPAGIAAAIYALTVPKPWTLIPLNAALHATAAVFLLRIMQRFLKPWRQAAWTVLPFLLYPSATLWYSQLHKDGYAICGFLAFLSGFLLLAETGYQSARVKTLLQGIFFIGLGLGLTLLVRPHLLIMFRGLGITAAILLLSVGLAYSQDGKRPWLTSGALVIAIVLLAIPYGERSIEKELPQYGSTSPSSSAVQGTKAFHFQWEASRWLPAALDSKFYTLSFTRSKYFWLYPEARSSLDPDVVFGSAGDLLTYLPRALQLGLFSPFPDQWIAEGSQPENTVMRRVAAFEMVGVYLSMLFIPFAMWQWRRTRALWLVLWFCLSMIVVHALTIPNAGSLYRVRYGYLMPIVALGVAGAVSIRQRYREIFNSRHKLIMDT